MGGMRHGLHIPGIIHIIAGIRGTGPIVRIGALHSASAGVTIHGSISAGTGLPMAPAGGGALPGIPVGTGAGTGVGHGTPDTIIPDITPVIILLPDLRTAPIGQLTLPELQRAVVLSIMVRRIVT